jgi:hypothetical protein
MASGFGRILFAREEVLVPANRRLYGLRNDLDVLRI